jgi:xylulokinase
MANLLGIDVGTSGCKVVLVDENGTLLRSASAEYPLSVPHPQWSEQNPQDWWEGVVHCLAEIGPTDVAAIGLTGQMHGAVFLDAEDEIIRPAILWNDQRTSAECAWIDATVGADEVRRITCNPPLTGFQAPKVVWLRNHEPEAFARVRSVLLPKDYIRFKLTGVKASEPSDASGTGIYDVPGRRWSEPMIRELGLDPAWFPPTSESWVVTAETNGAGGLAAGIPVVGGGGDQAAAAVGTGAVEKGIVSVSLGTSGVVFTSLDAPDYDAQGAAHTFCHANGAWHTMGVSLSCGGALRWYRDTIARIPYDAITLEAATAKPGTDGLVFLPYLTGERTPHNDPFAKAAFAGLTLGHGRADLSRAVIEGVSFALRDGMDLLRGLGADVTDVRVTGGGAKSPFWLGVLADLFGTDCTTLEVDEGPAFGAALLAGVGVGLWPNVAEACRATVRKAATVRGAGVDYTDALARYRSLYNATRAWN